ncbi:hypothetical protein LAZ67_10004017 [Cordylochernes scorpioides]|uniref:Uncharacterized protein n=1 Tax=Cordylochernes scorpioides TaxID=51811 RepID=A0ABY6KXD1_9ARAC|nr:hypothetical protein LAZ67_10004017 [Cordylochernes scorpioides]
MKRRQFPVKPAFVMTINKAQGKTLKRVGIYLPEPVFGHGQLYVAFSRVQHSSDVKIMIKDSALQGRLIEAYPRKGFSRKCNCPAAGRLDSPSSHRPIRGIKRSWCAGAELVTQLCQVDKKKASRVTSGNYVHLP